MSDGELITQATLSRLEASGQLSYRGAKIHDSKVKLVREILRLMAKLELTRSWPATSGEYLRVQRERKHFQMLLLMRKLSAGFRDVRHFDASVHLHTQRGQRSEQKQLSTGKAKLITQLKVALSQLKTWVSSPGSVPDLGFDIRDLEFNTMLAQLHCPWDQVELDSVGGVPSNIMAQAEQLSEKFQRCDEERPLLQREAKHGLLFFEHQIQAASDAITTLQVLKGALFVLSSLDGYTLCLVCNTHANTLQVLQGSLFDTTSTATTTEILNEFPTFQSELGPTGFWSSMSRTWLTQYCIGLQHLIDRNVSKVYSEILQRARKLWEPIITNQESTDDVAAHSQPQPSTLADEASSDSLSLWSSRIASDTDISSDHEGHGEV